jgi:4-hydroxyphenylacetate 3-monooxygenase
MLKSGADHLDQLRDGRSVFIGQERVHDVTAHRAFRNAARSVAAIYDLKAAADNRDALSFEEDGDRYSTYFLRPRSRDDLLRRTEAHRRIADLTYGMFGRSPDHVASFVTGMAINPEIFGPYAGNIAAYYKYMRTNDIYAAYAVVPPQAARNPAFYEKQNRPVPTLRVVRECDDGLVLSGMKMLATGAVFANEIWIGNLIPLAPDQAAESVTCVVPVNAPGLSLWARKPLEPNVAHEFEGPLTYRFDETDCMVMCDQVKVPWEHVFVHNDARRARAIYVETPAHCFGNHQSNVRYHSKLRLLVGLASRITQASGADTVPAVRETIGRLASLEALLGGMIAGQVQAAETWPGDFVIFNRRMMYAALNWCTESYSGIVDCLRELCGGGVFQMPADASVLRDQDLRALFETYFATPQLAALDRMKLFRLAWDLVGSEFAGRQQQYEKFYAGASFIVRNYSHVLAPWAEFHGIVDNLLDSYDAPGDAADNISQTGKTG